MFLSFYCYPNDHFFWAFPVVSLWKQEKGEQRTSGLLANVSLGITITTIVAVVIFYIVVLSVDVGMTYTPYYRNTAETDDNTYGG